MGKIYASVEEGIRQWIAEILHEGCGETERFEPQGIYCGISMGSRTMLEQALRDTYPGIEIVEDRHALWEIAHQVRPHLADLMSKLRQTKNKELVCQDAKRKWKLREGPGYMDSGYSVCTFQVGNQKYSTHHFGSLHEEVRKKTGINFSEDVELEAWVEA